MSELRDRMVRAAETLDEMAQSYPFRSSRSSHLKSKAEGVRLAISYLDEEERRLS